MISLIIFILILSFLVLVHEFGHYITAKRAGVYVEEFGLGIPPKIYGKKIGETEYTLNLLPFGGFVRLRGEDAEELTPGDLEDPRNFASKAPLQRLIILSAGVIMNLLLGVGLFYIFLGLRGFTSAPLPLLFDYDFKFGRVETIDTTIMGVSPESPFFDEEAVGLGDAILSIDGAPVNSLDDVREAVEARAGEPVLVTVANLQDGSITQLFITPYIEDGEEPVGRLGVYLGSTAQIYYDTPPRRAFSGFLHSYNVLSYSIATMGQLVNLSVEQGTAEPLAETVSGPVGIYSVVAAIVDQPGKDAFLNLIDLTALISLSLALLNILPLPALDGGRIFFVLAELVTGRRVKPKFEAAVHRVGIIALLGLLVLITIRDIGRFF